MCARPEFVKELSEIPPGYRGVWYNADTASNMIITSNTVLIKLTNGYTWTYRPNLIRIARSGNLNIVERKPDFPKPTAIEFQQRSEGYMMLFEYHPTGNNDEIRAEESQWARMSPLP